MFEFVVNQAEPYTMKQITEWIFLKVHILLNKK